MVINVNKLINLSFTVVNLLCGWFVSLCFCGSWLSAAFHICHHYSNRIIVLYIVLFKSNYFQIKVEACFLPLLSTDALNLQRIIQKSYNMFYRWVLMQAAVRVIQSFTSWRFCYHIVCLLCLHFWPCMHHLPIPKPFSRWWTDHKTTKDFCWCSDLRNSFVCWPDWKKPVQHLHKMFCSDEFPNFKFYFLKLKEFFEYEDIWAKFTSPFFRGLFEGSSLELGLG